MKASEFKERLESHMGGRVTYLEIATALSSTKAIRGTTELKVVDSDVITTAHAIKENRQRSVEPSGPADDPAPAIDPAIAAYHEWEEKTIIAMAPKAFEVIASRPHRDNDSVLMILFHPAVGEPRWITEPAAKLRQKRGTYAYYLLSRKLEAEGLQLIRQLPGCPQLDDACPICKKPLFASERALEDYLREDVLEKIIMDLVKVDDLKWRRKHTSCRKFKQWRDKYIAAKLQLESQLQLKKVSNEDRELALKVLNETWSQRGHRLIGWLSAMRYIRSEERDRLRASIDKITNTNNTRNERK